MRLRTCDKWHPDAPSEITFWVNRMECKACRRVRYKTNPPTQREKKLKTIGKPYGVVPLNWRPPEI